MGQAALVVCLEAIGNTGAQALYGQEAGPCHGVDLLYLVIDPRLRTGTR